jgi:hypothetical protein
MPNDSKLFGRKAPSSICVDQLIQREPLYKCGSHGVWIIIIDWDNAWLFMIIFSSATAVSVRAHAVVGTFILGHIFEINKA